MCDSVQKSEVISNKPSFLQRKVELIQSEAWKDAQKFDDLEFIEKDSKYMLAKRHEIDFTSINKEELPVNKKLKALTEHKSLQKEFMTDAIKNYSKISLEKMLFRDNFSNCKPRPVLFPVNPNLENEKSMHSITLKRLANEINSEGLIIANYNNNTEFEEIKPER